MHCIIKINMDNAAFQEYGDPSQEVARILAETAKRINGHPHFSPGHEQPLYDVNGNHVGDIDVYNN